MNIKLVNKYLLQIILSIVYFALFSQSLTAMDKEVVVIVNIENSLSDISSTDLRRIWLKKSEYVNDVKLSPMSSEIQIESKIIFYKSILKKSRKGLRKYYIREELKGVFYKPKSFETIDKLLSIIVSDSTAISFINKSDIPDSLDVKILSVDGKHVSDKNYQIK